MHIIECYKELNKSLSSIVSNGNDSYKYNRSFTERSINYYGERNARCAMHKMFLCAYSDL